MKLYIRTFGCRANQYDSERVRQLAIAGGVEIVDSPEAADTAVFNSCAVTAAAEADLRKAVRKAGRENPRLRSYVMGCASALELGRAARNSSDISTMPQIGGLPGVEAIFSGADIEGVARALRLDILADHPGGVAQTGARALLRIQDGCNEHCTFCATTLARGNSRSRPVEELVSEAQMLADHHREIVLTGVHIGSYGQDCRTSLGALVARLIAAVSRVRFRLSSIEATEVDEPLVEMLAAEPRRLAPYLHAPLQSGSDIVLKRMGRHWYSARTYRQAIERIARSTSILGLGADVIAGFPGESEDDHSASLELIRALPFTSLHVFTYSARPGTAAGRLPNAVGSAAAARRSRELRALGVEKAAAYAARRAGEIADVVVLDSGRRSDLASTLPRKGLTGDYLTVDIAHSAVAPPSRFDARLVAINDGLTAHPVTAS